MRAVSVFVTDDSFYLTSCGTDSSSSELWQLSQTRQWSYVASDQECVSLSWRGVCVQEQKRQSEGVI